MYRIYMKTQNNRAVKAPNRSLVVLALFVLVGFFLLESSEAKVFSRCDLAKELSRQGFEKSLLPDWVCLVESESSRNTGKKGGPNKNGSYDHGLFQINDKYWCENGKKGKDCNAKCEDLRTDDITEASKCAKKVYKRHGFNAWYGWKNKCQNKPKPDLSSCKI